MKENTQSYLYPPDKRVCLKHCPVQTQTENGCMISLSHRDPKQQTVKRDRPGSDDEEKPGDAEGLEGM